jgi:hypothetical protein
MYSCLDAVRGKLSETTERLFREIPKIRMAVIAIGDYCDQFESYVTSVFNFSSDPKAICKWIRSVKPSSGGDEPEAYELALRQARKLQWSAESAKAVVMIGDSPPHAPSYTTKNIWWKYEADALAELGIKCYGVHAMDREPSGEFYREIARRTGSMYVKFNNFQLITDMFLAVCLREANEEKLKEYVAEVKSEGRMTAELGTILDTLSMPDPVKPEPEKPKQTGPRVEWWDLEYDTGKPQYAKTLGIWRPTRSLTRPPKPKRPKVKPFKTTPAATTPRGASTGAGTSASAATTPAPAPPAAAPGNLDDLISIVDLSLEEGK